MSNCKTRLALAAFVVSGTVLLPGALHAADGPSHYKITPRLSTAISAASASEVFDVLVVLDDEQRRLNGMHRAAAAAPTLRARYRTVLARLQSRSRLSQSSLEVELREAKATGAVIDYERFWISNIIRVRANAAYLLELTENTKVSVIAENLRIELIAPAMIADVRPGVGVSGAIANLEAIGVRELWDQGLTGEGRLIASIDTGVEGTHPALAQSWAGNGQPSSTPYWFDPAGGGSSVPNDNNGHGTHVMGTMVGHDGADTIGLAPGARWISAGVIDRGGTLGQTIADILAAFEWLANPDGNPATTHDVPDVVCNSWGIPQGLQSPCDETFYGAIDNLEALGVVCIFAAGNEGPSSMSVRHPADRSDQPLCAFAVGAVDMETAGYPVASFSSRGPSSCGGVMTKPDLAAPGVAIHSAYKGGTYKNISGTSMAAPHVAAAALLLRQHNPDLTPEEIKQALVQSAIDVDAPGVDNATGYGLLNLSGALAAVPPTSVPNIEIVGNATADPYNNLPDPGETFDVTIELLSTGGNVHDVIGLLTSNDPRVAVNIDTTWYGTLSFGSIAANAESPFSVTLDGTVAIGDTLRCMLTLTGDSLLGNWSREVAMVCGLPAAAGVLSIDNANLSFGVGNFGQLGLGPGSLMPAGGAGFASDATTQNNVLYEAALLVSDGSGRLVDAARAAGAGTHANDFAPDLSNGAFEAVSTAEGAVYANASFTDGRAADPIGLSIDQTTTVYPYMPDNRYVLIEWRVRNTSGAALNDVRVGLILDWDINAPAAPFERVRADYALGHVRHTPFGPGPTVGVAFLNLPVTSTELLQNTGSTKRVLSHAEKIAAMTAAPSAPSAQYGDWCEIVSTGPFDMGPGAEIELVAALIEAGSGDEFAAAATAAFNRYAGVTGTGDDESETAQLPQSVELAQNYPNPFNPETVISYSLPRAGHVKIDVINVLGRTVRVLVDDWNPAGTNRVVWDGTDDAGRPAASGIYFYRIRTDEQTRARKMTLLR